MSSKNPPDAHKKTGFKSVPQHTVKGYTLPLAAYDILSDDTLRDQLWERWSAWRGAVSTHTVRAIVHDVKKFASWCAATGHQLLPADSAAVSLFLESEPHLAVATIERRCSSITTLHRLAGQNNPCDDHLVKWRLKAIRKQKGVAQRQAHPLRIKGDVENIEKDKANGLSVLNILAYLDTEVAELQKPKTPMDTFTAKLHLRDAAMLSVGYDAGLRASELVAIETKHITHNPDGAGELYVPFSKNDTKGEGSYRYLSIASMQRIEQWIEAAEIRGGAIFRGLTKSGKLMKTALRSGIVSKRYKVIVEGYLRSLKDNPFTPLSKEERDIIGEISGHSTRVGVVQDAVAAGEDLLGIMQAFDWKSPRMPAHYAAKLSVRAGTAARLHQKTRE